MKRASKNKNELSALAKIAQSVREKSGLGIKAFELHNNIASAYQNKVENGDIAVPNPKYLAKLSELSGRTIDELRMLTPNSQSKGRTFFVGMGNAIWFAPPMLAGWRGRTGAFRLSSFYERDESGARNIMPSPFPNERQCGGVAPSVPGPKGDSKLVSMAAPDLFDLLEAGQLDAILAPGELVREEKRDGIERFVEIAVILEMPAPVPMLIQKNMYRKFLDYDLVKMELAGYSQDDREAVSNAVELLETEKPVGPDAIISIEQIAPFYKFVSECHRKNKSADRHADVASQFPASPQLLAEHGTICFTRIAQITELACRGSSDPGDLNAIYLDDPDFHTFDLKDAFKVDENGKPENGKYDNVGAIIGWEPNMQWFLHRFSKRTWHLKYLRASPGRDGVEPPLVISLVVEKARYRDDPDFRLAVYDLLAGMDEMSAYLSDRDKISSGKMVLRHKMYRDLQMLLGLGFMLPSTLDDILFGLRFTVRQTLEGKDFLGERRRQNY